MKSIKISEKIYEILKRYSCGMSFNETIKSLIDCWGKHNPYLQQVLMEVENELATRNGE